MLGKCGLIFLLFLVSAPLAFAGVVFIDFEGLAAGTAVTNQYPDMVFSNATIATAFVNLDPVEFPPNSGINVVFDDGGPMTIDFLNPIVDFQAFFTYAEQLTITAFDASNTQVDTATSAFSANYTSSGNPPNESLSLSSAGGISSVVLAADPGGTSFVMDDLTFTTPNATVPEPSSIYMAFVATVLALVFSLKKRRATKMSGSFALSGRFRSSVAE